MKNSTKWFIGGSILSVVIAAGSLAHAGFHHKLDGHHHFDGEVNKTGYGHHGKKHMRLKKLDTNQDNMISEEEMRAVLKTHFDKLDLDQDGIITLDEFNQKPLERFAQMDVNSDMLLDRNEIKKHRKQRHSRHKDESDNSATQPQG